MNRVISVMICLLLLAEYPSFSQQISVSGRVMDKNTNRGIPFAAVQFKGSNVGTSTDSAGYYSFILNRFPSDTLTVHELGYPILNLTVSRLLRRQTINFSLSSPGIAMSEYVVHGGVNPALILLRKIIRNKPKNDPDYLDNFKSTIYNKLEVGIDNFNRVKLTKSALFKPFLFVLDNIDSTSQKEPFLPVFLSETFSDYYYRRKPKGEKEIITATRRSGFKNKSLTQFLGGIHERVNVYDNFISVFGKEFPSPISDLGTIYYDYKIVDTEFIDHRKSFRVSFIPKRKGETAFVGSFCVNDTTFAIQRMSMDISGESNINFVKSINLIEKYSPLSETRWFQTESKITVDFVLTTKKSMGLMATQTSYFHPVAINDTVGSFIFDEKKFKDKPIYILSNASGKPDSFWASHRFAKLSKSEQAVYKMVDTLQQIPAFKEYAKIARVLTTGKIDFGPIAVGPYYYLFNMNSLEKFRLRMGLNTTPEFSRNIFLHGYLAYGFGDKKFKGEMGIRWFLDKYPYRYIDFSYTHDLDNGGFRRYNDIGIDNIFSFAIRKRGTFQKFIMEDKQKLRLYNELNNGFSQELFIMHTNYSPFFPLPSIKFFPVSYMEGMNHLSDFQVGIKVRYAYHEEFIDKNSFDRISLGSKYPIAELSYSVGLKDVMSSNYSYQKAGVNIYGKVKIPPLGIIHYDLFGEKTFGTLPYLLLNVLPGNDHYYYNRHSFNMMHRYKFISDEYVGFFVEHDIGSGMFSYIPGIRRLKLRQFWTARGVMGSLSAPNRALNMGHDYFFNTLNNVPYMEIGTGVENIFQMIRIEGIWRVTPAHLQNGAHIPDFGVFGSLVFRF